MKELENSKSIDYGNSIFEKKSWEQIILIVGLLLYMGSLVVYILINLSIFEIGLHIILTEHHTAVGAIRVTITGIATILIATGLLSLRKNQEIQKKKIIASAVLFLLIVPLKMALEMIVFNYVNKLTQTIGSYLFWFFFFVIATSLFTDFIPFFIATSIVNSNIIKVEKKLKTRLLTSSIILGIILLTTIIIAILYVSKIGSGNIIYVFDASPLAYGFVGLITASIYIPLIVKWRKKSNIKS